MQSTVDHATNHHVWSTLDNTTIGAAVLTESRRKVVHRPCFCLYPIVDADVRDIFFMAL